MQGIQDIRAYAALSRSAVNCNACFDSGSLSRAGIGMPQPFTVGREYWTQSTRVVLVGSNPGAARDGGYKEARRVVLERFRSGEDSALDDYALAAERDVPLWANGKFLNRVEGIGLALPQIAFGNIALCATAGNKYPRGLLNRCFDQHTAAVLQSLRPHCVVLMGSAVEPFAQPIAKLLPEAQVITALHFAHREGNAVETIECERLRGLISPTVLTHRESQFTIPSDSRTTTFG